MTKPVIYFTHANGIPSKSYEKFLGEFSHDYVVHDIPYIGMDDRYPITPKWTYLVEEILDDIQQKCPDRAVVGLGHSFGGLLLLMCAYKQPDVFSQIIMMDPPFILSKASPLFEMMQSLNLKLTRKFTPEGLALKRRDYWESRDEAYQSLRNNRLFKNFDAQCFQDFMQSGICQDSQRGGVTLTIPKHVEAEVFKTVPAWWWRKPRKAPRVPVHLITSKKSHFYQQGLPQAVYKSYGIPHSVVEGTHMFPLEFPEHTAQHVKYFIGYSMPKK